MKKLKYREGGFARAVLLRAMARKLVFTVGNRGSREARYNPSNTAMVEQKLSRLSFCGTTPRPSTVTIFVLALVLSPHK